MQNCTGAWCARVKEACKAAVQALVTRDELVAEGEAWHEAPLLEPENGAEAAHHTKSSQAAATSCAPQDAATVYAGAEAGLDGSCVLRQGLMGAEVQ